MAKRYVEEPRGKVYSRLAATEPASATTVVQSCPIKYMQLLLARSGRTLSGIQEDVPEGDTACVYQLINFATMLSPNEVTKVTIISAEHVKTTGHGLSFG